METTTSHKDKDSEWETCNSSSEGSSFQDDDGDKSHESLFEEFSYKTSDNTEGSSEWETCSSSFEGSSFQDDDGDKSHESLFEKFSNKTSDNKEGSSEWDTCNSSCEGSSFQEDKVLSQPSSKANKDKLRKNQSNRAKSNKSIRDQLFKSNKAKTRSVSTTIPAFSEAEDKEISVSLNTQKSVEQQELKWTDCIGHEAAKRQLQHAIVWPLKYSWFFASKIRKPYKGVLLFGVPGVGKSMLIEIAASQANAKLFSVKGSDVKSEWFGKSESAIREIFEKAREYPMSIIFIDEIDSLCSARNESKQDTGDGLVTEILVQMDIKKEGCIVVVVGATNFPKKLDKAIYRRLEKKIYIGMPSITDRENFFRLYLSDVPHTLSVKDFQTLASSTEGLTGSDLEVILKNSSMKLLQALPEDNVDKDKALALPLTLPGIMEEIHQYNPTVTKSMIQELGQCASVAGLRLHGQRSRFKRIRQLCNGFLRLF